MRHNGNKVSRKGIRVNWNKVQPKIVSSRGVRDSIVIGRESIFSVCEKSQQEQWKGPDKRNEIFLKNVSGEDIPQRGPWSCSTSRPSPMTFCIIFISFFLIKSFLFFLSFCLPFTSWKTWDLDYSPCIPMRSSTWTLKLEDSYSEAPERFSQQSCFWGLGKWPVSLISWGKPPQQSPWGQSSGLHCTRSCKFWLFGGFTERSPGLVPAHIASNNRLVHNEKIKRKEEEIGIMLQSLCGWI